MPKPIPPARRNALTSAPAPKVSVPAVSAPKPDTKPARPVKK